MKKILLVSTASVLLFAMFYCKKDGVYETSTTDSLSPAIHNIVPDSILTKMKKLGFTVNEGFTPPNLENTYFVSPFVLDSSNVPNDYRGAVFADYTVKFYDQDNSKLTIKLNSSGGGETDLGLGGFLAGKNNLFTVFLKVKSEIGGDSCTGVFVISGKVEAGGIRNFKYANFMLNNYGNPHGYFIKNGQGRIIYDQDSISPVLVEHTSIKLEKALKVGFSSPFLK